MSGHSFDANIIIDALLDVPEARLEINRARQDGTVWVSRMAWIEVLSKGSPDDVMAASRFLGGFRIDELSDGIADRAAALRRERPKLRSPDAIILASAQVHGRILVTRNTKDFPAEMPGIRVPYTL